MSYSESASAGEGAAAANATNGRCWAEALQDSWTNRQCKIDVVEMVGKGDGELNLQQLYSAHQEKFSSYPSKSAIFTVDANGDIGIVMNGMLPVGTVKIESIMKGEMSRFIGAESGARVSSILSPNQSCLIVTHKLKDQTEVISNIDIRSLLHKYCNRDNTSAPYLSKASHFSYA